VNEDSTLQPTPADDLAILAVIAALDRQPWEEGFLANPPAELGESAETLTRLYTEALGLLPGELATPPPPVLKERLMAIVHGDETQEVTPVAPPEDAPQEPTAPPSAVAPTAPTLQLPPMPQTPQTTAPTAAPSPAAPTAPVVRRSPAPPASGTNVPAPSPPLPAGRPVRRSRWSLALAAMLVLALGLSGFLLYGLWQQGEKIDDLTRERSALIERLKSTGSNLDQVQKDMADLQERAALMTSPGVEISPLRPTGQVPVPEGTYGMLFVAADHQHWHLAVHGLTPAGAGRQYQFWFVSPQGAESGGTFTANPGTRMDLSSAHMPAGIQAVTITLEPTTATAAPSGPEVMRAGSPVKVL